MDLCCRHADKVADQWYQALMKNSKTAYLRTISQEACLRHATYFYTNLGTMYFAEDINQAIIKVLDAAGSLNIIMLKGLL